MTRRGKLTFSLPGRGGRQARVGQSRWTAYITVNRPVRRISFAKSNPPMCKCGSLPATQPS